MTENEARYMLCLPTGERTYEPLTLKDGSLYLMPKGVAEGKVADGGAFTQDMIIVDAKNLLPLLKESQKQKLAFSRVRKKNL
jgi:hypothetical protein